MGSLSNILPLIFLFIGVAIAAAIGYVVYSIVQDVKSQTQKKMEKKNVMFSRDGMKVGVKEVNDEEYKDRSQRYVASFWEVIEVVHGPRARRELYRRKYENRWRQNANL